MPLFDKDPPRPRRTFWDRAVYILAAVLIWAGVLYTALG